MAKKPKKPNLNISELTPRLLCQEVTWNRAGGHRGEDGVLSFSNLAYPILMSVTVEVVPP